MADKSSHLDQLKIDRSRPAGSSRGLVIGLVLVILLGAGGAGGYYYWQANAGIPVHAVTVADSGGGGGGAGLDASGYVVPQRQATLSAQIVGKVVYLKAEEGERVKEGDVIARVDDANYRAALRQAEAQEHQAKAALDDITPIFQRYQRLQSQNAISTDQFENERTAYDGAKSALEVAQAAVALAMSNESYTTVRAPFDGVVTVKVAQIGDIVAPTAVGGSGGTLAGIATIVDMDSLEVEVDVSENYIDRVRAGQAATVTLNAYPDWQIPASVIAVIPTADQSKGTVKVRLAMKVKDARILPQMGARVSFQTEPNQGPISHVLTVPAQAVSGNGDTGTVFLISGDRVASRQVKVGLRTSDSVTILSGVGAGDRLVTGDLTKLHDGDKVQVAEASS